MKIGEILKELREEKDLSQAKLSEETGISQGAISRWELNLTEPTASNIIILSKFFGKTSDYLLGIENEFGEKLIKLKEERTKTFNGKVTIAETKEKTIIEIEK